MPRIPVVLLGAGSPAAAYVALVERSPATQLAAIIDPAPRPTARWERRHRVFATLDAAARAGMPRLGAALVVICEPVTRGSLRALVSAGARTVLVAAPLFETDDAGAILALADEHGVAVFHDTEASIPVRGPSIEASGMTCDVTCVPDPDEPRSFVGDRLAKALRSLCALQAPTDGSVTVSAGQSTAIDGGEVTTAWIRFTVGAWWRITITTVVRPWGDGAPTREDHVRVAGQGEDGRRLWSAEWRTRWAQDDRSASILFDAALAHHRRGDGSNDLDRLRRVADVCRAARQALADGRRAEFRCSVTG